MEKFTDIGIINYFPSIKPLYEDGLIYDGSWLELEYIRWFFHLYFCGEWIVDDLNKYVNHIDSWVIKLWISTNAVDKTITYRILVSKLKESIFTKDKIIEFKRLCSLEQLPDQEKQEIYKFLCEKHKELLK